MAPSVDYSTTHALIEELKSIYTQFNAKHSKAEHTTLDLGNFCQKPAIKRSQSDISSFYNINTVKQYVYCECCKQMYAKSSIYAHNRTKKHAKNEQK